MNASNLMQLEDYIRELYRGVPNVDPEQLILQPYSYPIVFSALAAGTTQTGTINIAANSDFILTSPRYRAVVDAATPVVDATPLVRVLLTDAGSQQQLMNSQVDITTFFGHVGTAPYEIEYPRLISGRSSLTVQVTNFSNILVTGGGITYTSLELDFVGVQVRGTGN